MSSRSPKKVSIVATQRDTSFDDSNFSENSSGSLPSAGQDRYHVSIPQGGQLLYNHYLAIKPTSTGLEIKISIGQKVRQHENFKSPKK
jgi:hypothetical protein